MTKKGKRGSAGRGTGRQEQASHRGLRASLYAASALSLALAAIFGARAALSPAAKPPATPSSPGLARAVATSTAYKGGRVRVGTLIRASYEIRNEGGADLLLGPPSIRVEEGCCPPTPILGKTRLRPGERTTLSLAASMHQGMAGPHLFVIEVPTSDPTRPVLTFTFEAEWVE